MPEQRPGVAGWLAVCDLASIHRLTNFDRAKVYPALARCALLLGGTLESQRCSIRFADARLAARQLDQLLHHALDKTGETKPAWRTLKPADLSMFHQLLTKVEKPDFVAELAISKTFRSKLQKNTLCNPSCKPEDPQNLLQYLSELPFDSITAGLSGLHPAQERRAAAFLFTDAHAQVQDQPGSELLCSLPESFLHMLKEKCGHLCIINTGAPTSDSAREHVRRFEGLCSLIDLNVLVSLPDPLTASRRLVECGMPGSLFDGPARQRALQDLAVDWPSRSAKLEDLHATVRNVCAARVKGASVPGMPSASLMDRSQRSGPKSSAPLRALPPPKPAAKPKPLPPQERVSGQDHSMQKEDSGALPEAAVIEQPVDWQALEQDAGPHDAEAGSGAAGMIAFAQRQKEACLQAQHGVKQADMAKLCHGLGVIVAQLRAGLLQCPETELQGRLPQGVSRLSDQRTTGCKPVLVMLVMRTALLPAATDVLRDVLDADECRAVQLAGHVLLHFWVAASAAGGSEAKMGKRCLQEVEQLFEPLPMEASFKDIDFVRDVIQPRFGKELRLAVHALKLRSGLVLDVEDAASEPEAEVVDNEESADFNPASVPFAPLSGSKKRKSRPPSKGPSSRHTADALRSRPSLARQFSSATGGSSLARQASSGRPEARSNRLEHRAASLSRYTTSQQPQQQQHSAWPSSSQQRSTSLSGMSGGPSAVHSRRPQAAVLPQEVIASPGPSNLRPKHAVPDTPDQGGLMARAFLGTPQSRQKQQGAGSDTDDPEAIPTTLEKAPQAPRAPAIGSQPSRQLQFGAFAVDVPAAGLGEHSDDMSDGNEGADEQAPEASRDMGWMKPAAYKAAAGAGRQGLRSQRNAPRRPPTRPTARNPTALSPVHEVLERNPLRSGQHARHQAFLPMHSPFRQQQQPSPLHRQLLPAPHEPLDPDCNDEADPVDMPELSPAPVAAGQQPVAGLELAAAHLSPEQAQPLDMIAAAAAQQCAAADAHMQQQAPSDHPVFRLLSQRFRQPCDMTDRLHTACHLKAMSELLRVVADSEEESVPDFDSFRAQPWDRQPQPEMAQPLAVLALNRQLAQAAAPQLPAAHDQHQQEDTHMLHSTDASADALALALVPATQSQLMPQQRPLDAPPAGDMLAEMLAGYSSDSAEEQASECSMPGHDCQAQAELAPQQAPDQPAMDLASAEPAGHAAAAEDAVDAAPQPEAEGAAAGTPSDFSPAQPAEPVTDMPLPEQPNRADTPEPADTPAPAGLKRPRTRHRGQQTGSAMQASLRKAQELDSLAPRQAVRRKRARGSATPEPPVHTRRAAHAQHAAPAEAADHAEMEHAGEAVEVQQPGDLQVQPTHKKQRRVGSAALVPRPSQAHASPFSHPAGPEQHTAAQSAYEQLQHEYARSETASLSGDEQPAADDETAQPQGLADAPDAPAALQPLGQHSSEAGGIAPMLDSSLAPQPQERMPPPGAPQPQPQPPSTGVLARRKSAKAAKAASTARLQPSVSKSLGAEHSSKTADAANEVLQGSVPQEEPGRITEEQSGLIKAVHPDRKQLHRQVPICAGRLDPSQILTGRRSRAGRTAHADPAASGPAGFQAHHSKAAGCHFAVFCRQPGHGKSERLHDLQAVEAYLDEHAHCRPEWQVLARHSDETQASYTERLQAVFDFNMASTPRPGSSVRSPSPEAAQSSEPSGDDSAAEANAGPPEVASTEPAPEAERSPAADAAQHEAPAEMQQSSEQVPEAADKRVHKQRSSEPPARLSPAAFDSHQLQPQAPQPTASHAHDNQDMPDQQDEDQTQHEDGRQPAQPDEPARPGSADQDNGPFQHDDAEQHDEAPQTEQPEHEHEQAASAGHDEGTPAPSAAPAAQRTPPATGRRRGGSTAPSTGVRRSARSAHKPGAAQSWREAGGLPPGITAEFYHDWRFAVVCCDPCHSDVRRLKDLNAVIKYMRAHADCREEWQQLKQQGGEGRVAFRARMGNIFDFEQGVPPPPEALALPTEAAAAKQQKKARSKADQAATGVLPQASGQAAAASEPQRDAASAERQQQQQPAALETAETAQGSEPQESSAAKQPEEQANAADVGGDAACADATSPAEPDGATAKQAALLAFHAKRPALPPFFEPRVCQKYEQDSREELSSYAQTCYDVCLPDSPPRRLETAAMVHAFFQANWRLRPEWAGWDPALCSDNELRKRIATAFVFERIEAVQPDKAALTHVFEELAAHSGTILDEELSEASSLAPEELQRQAVSAGRQPSASVGDRQQEENPAAPPASEAAEQQTAAQPEHASPARRQGGSAGPHDPAQKQPPSQVPETPGADLPDGSLPAKRRRLMQERQPAMLEDAAAPSDASAPGNSAAGCLPAGVTRLVKKSSSGMRVFYCANVPDKPERSRLDMSQLQILAAFFRQHADARPEWHHLGQREGESTRQHQERMRKLFTFSIYKAQDEDSRTSFFPAERSPHSASVRQRSLQHQDEQQSEPARSQRRNGGALQSAPSQQQGQRPVGSRSAAQPEVSATADLQPASTQHEAPRATASGRTGGNGMRQDDPFCVVRQEAAGPASAPGSGHAEQQQQGTSARIAQPSAQAPAPEHSTSRAMRSRAPSTAAKPPLPKSPSRLAVSAAANRDLTAEVEAASPHGPSSVLRCGRSLAGRPAAEDLPVPARPATAPKPAAPVPAPSQAGASPSALAGRQHERLLRADTASSGGTPQRSSSRLAGLAPQGIPNRPHLVSQERQHEASGPAREQQHASPAVQDTPAALVTSKPDHPLDELALKARAGSSGKKGLPSSIKRSGPRFAATLATFSAGKASNVITCRRLDSRSPRDGPSAPVGSSHDGAQLPVQIAPDCCQEAVQVTVQRAPSTGEQAWANRGHEHDLAVDQDKPAAQQLQDGPGPASAATSLQGASLSSGPDDCPFPRPKDKLLLGVEDEGQTVIDEFIVKKVPKAAQMTVNAGGSVSGVFTCIHINDLIDGSTNRIELQSTLACNEPAQVKQPNQWFVIRPASSA